MYLCIILDLGVLYDLFMANLGLDNSLKVIADYLLIGSMGGLSHRDEFLVRPEKFQFMEKGQNCNFGYEIVISVKNMKFIL